MCIYRSGSGGVGGAFVADDLQKLHRGHGREVVHANHVLWAFALGRNVANWNGGGVACVDGVVGKGRLDLLLTWGVFVWFGA
jgi:hypothetical protein